jgi:hypothetical protein
LHHRLIAARETFAFITTRLAEICADPTILRVVFAHTEHEIGGCQTGVSAICKKSLMMSACVLAAQHQAVSLRFSA